MMNIKYPSIKQFFLKLGPGLVTGASDDDPSGIATYSQAGAAFGLATLWTSLIAFPLMAAIQQMCARIGFVTNKGLSGTIKQYYSKKLLYIMLLFSFPAIILNIGFITTPCNVLLVVFNVAVVFPSYGLSDAVIPVTINCLVFTVIEQVVLAAA